MDKKTAVYICTGCGIGDALDVDPIKELATDELSIPLCKDHLSCVERKGLIS